MVSQKRLGHIDRADSIALASIILILGGWLLLLFGAVRRIGGYALGGPTLFLIVLGAGMMVGGLALSSLFGDDGFYRRWNNQPPETTN